MSQTTIAWTDRTENPLTGCTEVRVKGAKESECDNCYARVASASPRLQQFEKYHGVVNEKGRWTGQINFTPKVLDDLLRIKKPQRIFMPSMSDLFHLGVKDEWLDQIFATIALTPHLTYQILTKRPERMLKYSQRDFYGCIMKAFDMLPKDLVIKAPKPSYRQTWPLSNVWLGVTSGTQKAADERIPLLLQAPAAVRFVSVEPMLEPMTLTCLHYAGITNIDCLTGQHGVNYPLQGTGNKINQVIIGGESGTNARPFELAWARSLIDQCREAGTKIFMKQVGSNAFYEGKPFKTKSRAGSDPSEWPEWAQIQEFPA
jgi:protein gp37